MNNNFKKIGILGYGEIGKAVAKFYNNPKIKDLDRDDNLKGVDVLHVCIPWVDNFVDMVRREIDTIKPKLTIIHSTVAPGTTKKIGGTAVHSPVRGVHPHLYEGIKTFIKYIGADDKIIGKMAENHLNSIGIKTDLLMPSIATEALKLWDTTQYGWMIILNKEIKKWCDKVGVDFDKIYLQANKTYNSGYKKLRRPDVMRPYLKYMPGDIGGHCVIQNCQILGGEIAEVILKKNKEYKNKKTKDDYEKSSKV
jgi:UDP-N-acetyl-D-mannosaminuronate dehydrogenase